MMLASFYFQCCSQLSLVLVLHYESGVYVSFYAVCKGVKFLLCSNKLAELELILVFLWPQNLIEPLCNIFDSLSGILLYLSLVLIQRE